jgi:hypothetical protein
LCNANVKEGSFERCSEGRNSKILKVLYCLWNWTNTSFRR